jgi:hypothetical protein
MKPKEAMITDTTSSPLAAILAATTASGWHQCNWSELRASSFPGVGGWAALKTWCGEHDLDCQICFSQASRTAEVQFRNRHFKARIVDASAAAPVAPEVSRPPSVVKPQPKAVQVRAPAAPAKPTPSSPAPASLPEVKIPKAAVVGIPWCQPDHYQHLRSKMSDGDDLPRDYETWATNAAALATKLRAQGIQAIRVTIEPDAFMTWCKAVRIDPDARARQGFANEKAFCSHLAQD